MNNSRFCVSMGLVILTFLSTTVVFEEKVHADDEATWQPQRTRVFLVSLTRFKSERLHSFSTDDRLDDRFAQLFRDRGVPNSQIVLLKDDEATTQNIQSQFSNLLRQSMPREALFFYFGSHGSYDRKTGVFSYCAFNDNVSFAWVFDEIERHFRGTQAILAADCCYSGGISELVTKRKTPIAYACLSSTYSHQVARSGWRFAQCLMRGFSGNPVVDLDGNGHVDLDELAHYTARYMAFAADGKPMFQVTGGFNPKLRLTTTVGTKGPRVGELLEVHSNSAWKKAEVLEADSQKLKIHFTEDTRTANDGWFAIDRARPFRFERYPAGSTVEVESSSDEDWHLAKVTENWESLHRCRYDGSASAYDEWFGPGRIRKTVAGSWSGRWKNSLDEVGPETLDLAQGKHDKLSGSWSGDATLKGERIGKTTIYFEATRPGRFYRCAGRIEGARLVLNYIAHRVNESGHYYGWAELGQPEAVLNAVRDPHFEFAGKWSGTYENSRGGSGVEKLTLTESAEKLHGVWSGVEVSGERLGNATFFLDGVAGKIHYHVIGHVAEGHLVLDYFAASGNEHYTGRSTLRR